VEIHDVSPFHREKVFEAVEFLGKVGIAKYSILLIPNFQNNYAINRHVKFIEFLKSLGQEILLHGYSHWGKPKLIHILSTYREGEFGGTSLEETYQRIDAAVTLFELVGLKANVFVPPAWIGNKWLEKILYSFGFWGIAYKNAVKELRKNHRIWAPALTFSNRYIFSHLSLISCSLLYKLYSQAKILRLCLHMADFKDTKKIKIWEKLLNKFKKERRFLNYNDLLSKGRFTSSFKGI